MSSKLVVVVQSMSYWAFMLSSVQHMRQVCHGRKKTCNNVGAPSNQYYQAVSVRTAALLHDGGAHQLLYSVFAHHAASRMVCEICCEGREDWKEPVMKSVTEQWLKLPIVLLASVFSQQVGCTSLVCNANCAYGVAFYAASVCARGAVFDVWLKCCNQA